MKTVIQKFIVLILLFTCAYSYAQQTGNNYFVDAMEAYRHGNHNIALAELDSVFLVAPNHSQAHRLRAKIWEAKDSGKRALLDYDRAIESNPSYIQAYLERAHLRFELDFHRDYILKDLDQAIILEPGNYKHYVLKAYYLANTSHPKLFKPDFAAAINEVGVAIAIEKENAYLYSLRSKYKVEHTQFLSALNDINEAIALADTVDQYHAQRGLIRLMIEDFKSAMSDYTRAIQRNDKNQEYYRLRAHAKYNLGYYDGAIKDYDACISLIKDDILKEKTAIQQSHPLNKALRSALLLRGMALVQTNSRYDGCDDFDRAFEMGERKAVNYIRRYCN